jgi:tetratricopeptide (TPR) repeat protein
MSQYCTPSADPQGQLGEVLADWLEAAERGTSPDEDDYLRRYPEFATELAECFADWKRFPRPGGLSARPSVAAEPSLPTGGQLGDFQLIREVGRGGMGIVYEAEQVSLGRRVALKVLPIAATMDPRHLQRFQNEARAAAGLHHTNIVPVYGVGNDRGVHYYAMQFIDGQTLADLIAQHRQGRPSQVPTAGKAEGAASATTSPPAAQATSAAPRDQAYFQQVAEWGIQAAEALDCAHSLGVVHRDVKPANLLVDGTGRLWVTDFGLAQVQSDARLTMTGDLVGTLRYMSPEQALAKRVVIDHRTDIYSLGATLYELLTLEPAFRGNDRQDLLRQIAFEEPKAPRRVNKTIPAELETIVLKALEKNPAERYATAQELADDLERFLRDEPIRARRPSLARRARKWARRHRPVVWGAVVVTLLAGGAGLWYRLDRAERRADQRRGAEEAVVEAQRLQGQARWPQARAVLAQALAQLGETAPIELRQPLEQAQRDLDLVARLDSIRLKKVIVVENKLYWVNADPDYAAAFREAGLVGDKGEEATAVAARIVGSAIRPALVAALDDWAGTTEDRGRRAWLLDVARRADPDSLRDRARDPAVWDNAKALARLAGDIDVAVLAPQLLGALGDRLKATGGDPLPLLRAAQARYPDDFWTNFDLANRLDKTQEAIGYYRAALALRPDASAVYSGLGCALFNSGQLPEALAAWQQAVRLAPQYAPSRNNLGAALLELGRRDEAIAEFREAIALDPQNAGAHNNLGEAMHRSGQLDEAIAEFQKAIRLNHKNASAHTNLGSLLDEQGRWDEAIVEHQQAIRLDPNDARPHDNLGNALKHKGRLDEAIAEHKKAIDLDPRFAKAHTNLGNALARKGQVEAAIIEYRKAIQIDPRDAVPHHNLGKLRSDRGDWNGAIDEYRAALSLKKDFAQAHSSLGVVLLRKGQIEEAIAACREAVRINKELPHAHCSLGNALLAKGELEEAIAAFQQALALNPNDAIASFNLGIALFRTKRVDQAIPAVQQAIRLDPKDYQARTALGTMFLELGRLAETRQVLRDVEAEMPADHPLQEAAMGLLHKCEHLIALEGKLPAILRGTTQPRDASERIDLAMLCSYYSPKPGHRYAAAARFYAEAFAAAPDRAEDLSRPYRSNAACCALRAACGDGADASALDDQERARLRGQALAWVRADLAAWRKALEKDAATVGPALATHLRDSYLQDEDLAMRTRLPVAERDAWAKVWAEVDALLARAGDPSPDR